MQFLQRKPNLSICLGLSENEQSYCLVCYKLQRGQLPTLSQTACFWLTKQEDELDNRIHLLDWLWQSVGFSSKTASQFQLVRSVAQAFIWRKSVLLPKVSNTIARHRQVHSILSQELPLPLDDVFFDYQHSPSQDAQCERLCLYALRKSYAEPLMLTPNIILDSELLCAARGAFLLQKEQDLALAKLQPFTHHGQIWGLNEQELVLQKNAEITPLVFPAELTTAQQALYLAALGAALW